MEMNVIAFFVGIVLLLFLLVKTKINAFLSMLIASLAMGLIAGLGGVNTVKVITTGFAGTIGSIGIIIIFGTILGKYLEIAKAVNRIAESILNVVGEKNGVLAMLGSGFLVSIPVFVDVAFIMIMPLVRSISRRTGMHIGALATALALALLNTNNFVPPTPGPLAVAGILELDIGRAIGWGLVAAIIPTIFAGIFAQYFLARKDDSWYGYSEYGKELKNEQESIKEDNENLPGFWVSVMPILLPVALIIANTTCKAIFPKDSAIVSVTSFIGDSNIAIGLGIILAIVALKSKMKYSDIFKVMDESLKECGPIIFITAGGGALARVINATGSGELIASSLVNSGLPLLLVPFLISGISKFVQGSGSVAMIMAATLSAPLAINAGVDPLIIFLSACAGSALGSQINNSYFWVFANLTGFDVKTSVKTLCLGQQIIALGGLISTVLISMVI